MDNEINKGLATYDVTYDMGVRITGERITHDSTVSWYKLSKVAS